MSSFKPLINFYQISQGAFCQKGIANLFKWFRTFKQNGRMPIYDRKNTYVFFSRTKKAWGLNLGI